MTIFPDDFPHEHPSRMKVQVYQDKKGEWRWRLKAGNSRVVADSGEGYTNRADCESMLARIANPYWELDTEDA